MFYICPCKFDTVWDFQSILPFKRFSNSFLIYPKVVSHFSESGGEVQAVNQRRDILSFEKNTPELLRDFANEGVPLPMRGGDFNNKI